MEGKEKIVLKDGTEVEIKNGAVENCLQVTLPDLDGFKELHGKFSETNLENYTIKNAAGLTCANYENKHLESALVKQRKNGFLISFNLADVNMLEKRVATLETGQDVQDGAIDDLGNMVSEIMEGGEV